MPTSLVTIRETVANSLGCMLSGTISAAAAGARTVVELADLTVDDQQVEDWFVWIADGHWRRVASFVQSTQVVTAARNFASTPTNTAATRLYAILSPDEWDNSINEALQELFFIERVSVTPTADTNLYDLTTTNTWLTSKGQILDIRWRDIADGASNIKEWSAPGWDIFDDADTLTLYFPIMDNGNDVTNFRVQVIARRYYASLASSDSATTTCPAGLIFAAAKHKALLQIWHKYGKRAKELFGAEMVVSEKVYSEMRRRWLPQLAPQAPHQREQYAPVGPNIPTWSW